VNGNGRAVYPPASLTPMTLYRQPLPERPSRKRVAARIVFWLFAAALMLAVAFVGGAYLWVHESVKAVRAHSADVKRSQQHLNSLPPPGKAAIALVVGYDHRAGVEKDLPSRSDTIMLIRADPQTKSISLLSFPRDLNVPIKCPNHQTFTERINAAYTECGSLGTLETVRALTGLPVNYLITVNFHGFKQIVDRVGGVWIDVDRRYFNNNAGLGPGFTYATINLQPGYQKLDGSQALDYARYRHTDSDLYRVARQQQFVKALKEQVKHSFSPFKIPGLVGAITHNVEVGVGGKGELSGSTVLSYALFAYHLPPGHFFQVKIPNLQPYGIGGAELITDPSNIQSAVHDFVNPDVSAPTAANNSALGIKVRSKAPPPSRTSIVVLNGNNVEGAAASAGSALAQRGYRMGVPPNGRPANAPTFDYFHTKVYFRHGDARGKAAAQKVANLFGAADVAPLPRPLRSLAGRAMLVVVVGATFHNSLAPPPAQTVPKREPAQVVSNPGLALPLLRAVRRRVPFTLQNPTVIESTSSLVPYPDEVPVRVYRIQGPHKAVRLTFRTAGSEYWGIEETDWKDAPVLADRNFSHVIKGREYDLYYSGSHLHMVVLRTRPATYWVVNTLLDSLSNETMLAIAKGLRPLPK
jgi:LCP family protein required for cell wall assembly